MRKLFQGDLPTRYPITSDDFADAHRGGYNPIQSFRDELPPADWEPGVGAFSRKDASQMGALVEARARYMQSILERGYTSEQRSFSEAELAYGAGLKIGRFFNEASLDPMMSYSKLHGIPYAFHLGNIEGPHGVIFREMLQRVSAKAHHVLNIGCGPVGFQHVNIESHGIENIAYADINLGHDTIGTVRSYLDRFGRKDVVRSYTVIDKNDAGALKQAFDRQSITAVIRTGVGEITESELEGLNHILAPDGELFVANSLRNQPIGTFLNAVEPSFEHIEVHIGFERYVLVCKKAA